MDFPSLEERLLRHGRQPKDVLIVRAGEDYPKRAMIFPV